MAQKGFDAERNEILCRALMGTQLTPRCCRLLEQPCLDTMKVHTMPTTEVGLSMSHVKCQLTGRRCHLCHFPHSTAALKAAETELAVEAGLIGLKEDAGSGWFPLKQTRPWESTKGLEATS